MSSKASNMSVHKFQKVARRLIIPFAFLLGAMLEVGHMMPLPKLVPANLLVLDFVGRWTNCWALTLVKLHREITGEQIYSCLWIIEMILGLTILLFELRPSPLWYGCWFWAFLPFGSNHHPNVLLPRHFPFVGPRMF